MKAMRAIMKREVKNYLKRPLFWAGVLLVILGVYQNLEPYLRIHYVVSEDEVQELVGENPKMVPEADISDGYVPTDAKDRRRVWEAGVREDLILEFQMDQAGAEAVIQELRGMDIEAACAHLEKKYQFYNALYKYEDTGYHQGTKDEINTYIKEQLGRRRFSYYLSRKFADFAGLFMCFFAAVMLAVLFLQDTKRSTYELLHTKQVSAWAYVSGKIAGGFLVCLFVLAVLNLVFWAACLIRTKGSGFEVQLSDFFVSTALYILPNMLMVVSVYALVSLAFRSPLPAVPLLILYMVYSNMGSRNAEGVYGYYGRPFAIMVRFPGCFFDTAPPPMVMQNQCFLVLASMGIMLFCMHLWKRRRM